MVNSMAQHVKTQRTLTAASASLKRVKHTNDNASSSSGHRGKGPYRKPTGGSSAKRESESTTAQP